MTKSNPYNLIIIEKRGGEIKSPTTYFTESERIEDIKKVFDARKPGHDNYILAHFGGKNNYKDFLVDINHYSGILQREQDEISNKANEEKREHRFYMLPISKICCGDQFCKKARELHDKLRDNVAIIEEELKKFHDNFSGCNEEIKKRIVFSLLPLWIHVERTIRFRNKVVSEDIRYKIKEALVDFAKMEEEELWSSRCNAISENLKYLIEFVRDKEGGYKSEVNIDLSRIDKTIKEIMAEIQKSNGK